MNFNITSTSLVRLAEEGALCDVARLQELAEPSGLQSSFSYTGETLVQLRKALSELFKDAGSDWGSSNVNWQDYDGKAAVLIHQALSELPRDIAMSKGFWRYQSVYCSEIVCKRYGYNDLSSDFDKRHFGDEIFNSLLSRLWFRGELSIDLTADDPYWLTRKGLSDFWSSFVLRRIYAQSKPLIRSLIKYFFVPDDVGFSRDGVPLTTVEAFRLIGPAVRRQHSLSPFELMDETDCRMTLEMLATELLISRIGNEK
jgi:hypothetical protein